MQISKSNISHQTKLHIFYMIQRSNWLFLIFFSKIVRLNYSSMSYFTDLNSQLSFELRNAKIVLQWFRCQKKLLPFHGFRCKIVTFTCYSSCSPDIVAITQSIPCLKVCVYIYIYVHIASCVHRLEIKKIFVHTKWFYLSPVSAWKSLILFKPYMIWSSSYITHE